MTSKPSNISMFTQEYGRAEKWQQLSWAHMEPTPFLADICIKRGPGKALDIGCGAGTDSVFLAKQGWDVTSLDFIPKAIEMTTGRAKDAGVSVTTAVADVLDWQPKHKYDLVLDHGLLHNMNPGNHPIYRQQIFKFMSDDADFVILHWLKTYPWQPVAMVGPNRASREEIKDFFAPEMAERYFVVEEMEDLPWFVGGALTQATFWFTHNNTNCKPAELITQIKSTLDKQSVDYEALISEAGDGFVEAELPANMMARMAGPGRLGMSHVIPKRDEGSTIIKEWAERSGQNPHYVENLLRVFAAKEHGNVCTDIPKCHLCQTVFCKRLRNK